MRIVSQSTKDLINDLIKDFYGKSYEELNQDKEAILKDNEVILKEN